MIPFSKNSSFSLIVIISAFLFFSCGGKFPATSSSTYLSQHLDSLITAKDFFTAAKIFRNNQDKLPRFQQLKTGMSLDNAFNKPASSLQKYEELKEKYQSEISDSLNSKLASIARDNYLKLYEYEKLAELQEKILSEYTAFISAEEQEDLQNTLIIWKALAGMPKQEVLIPGEVRLPLHRDKAGLKNLEVTAGNSAQHFIFDTGANFSTITESTAKDFKLIILEGTFEVNSITGNKVRSQIAVAPEIRLGEIVIKNVVFLVFPDSALAFPQIDFQINGILGFPVIEALKEIQITQTDEFIVPLKQTEFLERNLAIDFLTPIIYLQDANTSGSYTFDTGAGSTMLYSTYYKQLNDSVTAAQPEVDYSFGGAGGHITKKGFYHTYTPVINGRTITIDSVMVLKDPIDPKNNYYGNIGQDLIGNFQKMTINFDKMFIKFD